MIRIIPFLAALLVAGPALAGWDAPYCGEGPGGRGATCVTVSQLRDAKAGTPMSMTVAIAGDAASATVMLMLQRQGWAMPDRDGLEVGLEVDDRHLGRRKAVTKGDAVTVILKIADLTALMVGNAATIDMPRARWGLPLRGSRAAIKALSDAWLARVGHGDGADPFGGAESAPEKPPVAPKRELRT